MRRSVIAHILLVVLVAHALAGGASGAVVICLGGHEHGPAETGHCQSACSHSSTWFLPMPAGDYDDDYGCTDVELEVAELLRLLRGAHGPPAAVAIMPCPQRHGLTFVEAARGRRGSPAPPPWFDPSSEQRFLIVSSVRLTL